MRDWIPVGMLAIILCLLLGTTANAKASSEDFSVLPKVYQTSSNPNEQQQLLYDFIWRSFIALNWPNVPLSIEVTPAGPLIVSGSRGTPDPSMRLSVMSGSGILPQTVWETYKEPFEVFPPPDLWDQWGEWNSVRPPPPDKKPASGESRTLLGYPMGLTGYATDTMQPYFFPFFTGPLRDQNGGLVRYEVAVNRAFFRYVRHFQYYNAKTQRESVRNFIEGKRDETAFQRPPFGNPAETGPGGYLHDLPDFQQTGFVDVKAAWRVLDPDSLQQVERYLHRDLVVGYEKDGTAKTQLMGLVALHILRWTPNGYDPKRGIDGGFVASTFEHIDNVRASVDRHGNAVKPTFNNGLAPTSEQREYGFAGDIPKLSDRPVSIYRARSQAISTELRTLNRYYQTSFPVSTSVLRYYQLIGTQNHHQGPVSFETAADREKNGPQGPITGVITNTNNLVNSVLESYTQKNFACILCHSKARPFGVVPSEKQMVGVPDKAFQDDHFKILTFLLQSAHEPKKKQENGD